MQVPISNIIQLGDTLNSLKDYSGVPSIYDKGTLESIYQKVDKVTDFMKIGKGDGNLSRYFPNFLPVSRQSQIAGELPRKAYASVTCTNKKQLEFVLELTANTCSNYSSMKICLPVQFYAKNKTKLVNIMTVNNFFGNWFSDIDIRRYSDDKRILPTINSVDIYQYSNAQMKYLPEKAVKKILKTMLYSNKPVYLDEDVDRGPNNSVDDNKSTDPNLTYLLNELKDYIFEKHVYIIPLGLIVDLGHLNFITVISVKTRLFAAAPAFRPLYQFRGCAKKKHLALLGWCNYKMKIYPDKTIFLGSEN